MNVRNKFTCLMMIHLLVLILILSGCTRVFGNNDATTIRVANNLGIAHPSHDSLEEFATLIAKNTDGAMGLEIFPNGMLGGERNVIEMIQAGVLEFSRVSAGALEAFNEAYQIFSLPYVFHSQEHFHSVMNYSEAVQDIFMSTEDQRFIAIGWMDAGQRSIYLREDIKVTSPEDLNGISIRVMESPTTIEMIRLMGGVATPMPFGEVYTGLQQGIIDGAENNETALTLSGHGEVTGSYTFTEHQFTPDIIIVSTRFWNDLTIEEQEMFRDIARQVSKSHIERWNESVLEAVTISEQEMGVNFYHIDKTPFIEATAPMREEFVARNERNRYIMENFLSFLNE